MLKCFYILIWITVFRLCFCHRRMGLGNDSILGKKYLVYFVKSSYSNLEDDAWICAGAIVTPTQILTAAACLVDMNNIYVIAGYKKYVHGRDIEKDKCTSTWKKKIVKISVPKEYSKSNSKQVEWMNVDVGVATVQEPYNFGDHSYLTHCSYAPQSIMINYDKENEVEKTRAIALGWGGEKVEEVEESEEIPKEKLKPQLLQEATTNIIDNTFCANLVAKNGSKELVNKYLLCASGNGFLGEDGDETISDPILEDLPVTTVFVLNNGTESGTTNKIVDSGPKNTNFSTTSKQINQADDMSSRKSSLLETCQNDHGGPLVTWIETEETILGVALNGICNPNFDCVGPRIYVSTASTANIIKCLLETNETRRKTCNDHIDDERYKVNDIEIKWPEELKTNTTSLLSIQQIPSLRRQLGNEETPLQIRQTRDLRDYDGEKDPQSNPRNIPIDNSQEIQHPYDNKQDKQRGNSQEIPRKDRYDSAQEIQHDYLQGNRRAEETPHENSTMHLNVNHQASDPQLNPNYTQQNLPQADQTKGSAGQKLDDQNWTPIPKSQQQIESKYSPETMSDNQFQSKILALAQINNRNLMDLYSHLQVHSFIKPNQPESPINNDESITNQPVREINNNPQMSTYQPELDSFMPLQEHSYNEPQTRFLKPRPMKTVNQALKNILKLSSFEQLPGLDLPFNMPQGEFYKGTGSHQSKAKFSSLTRYSNREPTRPPYDHTQMEALKPRLTQSYNPLDIIMSENQPEDDSFKYSMKEPHRASIVEPIKQSSVDPYIQQPFNPAVVKPYEQPHLSQNYQLNSPHNVQALPSDPRRPQNPLRLRDRPLNPSHGNSQTFEQLFSQLQESKPELWAPAQAPVTTEETFEELYRKLHDGKYEETHEFKTEFDPIKGEFEQTNGSMNEGSKDNVQVRQQKPLEYPDYT